MINTNNFRELELTVQFEILAFVFRAKKNLNVQESFDTGTYVDSRKRYEIAENCSVRKDYYFLKAMTAMRKAAKVLHKKGLIDRNPEDLTFRELKSLYRDLEDMVSDDTNIYY